MECCKHKKLFAYQLIKQLEAGLVINEELGYSEYTNLEIFCKKCNKWNIIKSD